MPEQIQLPQLMRGAEFRAASFDEKDNTIEVIFTAGATVRRVSWIDGEFDEELMVSGNSVRLDRLNSGAPLLDTHSRFTLDNVIGSVVRGTARIEGGRGIARVRLSSAETAADRVAKIKEGTVSSISVGYRIHAVEKTEREGKIALHRVIDWEPFEISAVPVPADPGAYVRSEGADGAMYSCRVIPSIGQQNSIRRARMQMAQRMIDLAS